MSRTIRRKHYIPCDLLTKSYSFIDPRTGVQVWWAGEVELEGKERAAKLRWWHEDKSCWWGVRPPKPYRLEVEVQHRMQCKTELARWWKDPDYEPLVRCKGQLGYWD